MGQSKFWEWQKRSYQTKGINHWAPGGGVPHWATSNIPVANANARMVMAMIKDWEATHPEAVGQPWSILEMGAGIGQFTFLLLQQLEAYRKSMRIKNPIHVIQSDCVQDNLIFGPITHNLKCIATKVYCIPFLLMPIQAPKAILTG